MSSRVVKWVVGVLMGAVVAFTAVTLVALEASEVVILRTHAADGSVVESRIWVADHNGVPHVEAAESGKGFYQNLLARPQVELVRGGVTEEYTAVPLPSPEGNRLIRRLLLEKYGMADRWVGLLVDTSASMAVRLEPR